MVRLTGSVFYPFIERFVCCTRGGRRRLFLGAVLYVEESMCPRLTSKGVDVGGLSAILVSLVTLHASEKAVSVC